MKQPTTRNSSPTGLDQAIDGLEPLSASPDFTDRVMEALSRGDRASHGRADAGRRWAALAALAAASVTLGILLGLKPEPPIGALTEEAGEIRRQHSELVDELQTLRGLEQATRPVIYLGSEGDVDLVLDLGALIDEAVLDPGAPNGQRYLEAGDAGYLNYRY